MITNLLIAFCLIMALHYLIFLLRIFNGLRKLNNAAKQIPLNFNIGKVSVIIPFRNEEVNIVLSLRSIEAQDYPEERFEVIYVNDSSTDKSFELLCKTKTRRNIKVICVPDNYTVNRNKKRAVSFGIEHSSGEIIITTDADCIHSPKWISSLISGLNEETAFISGPVEFFDEENYFSSLQKTEFAGLVLAGAGLIGAGTPLICNAANIAYRRDTFTMVGGFAYNHELSSGDDELLMQKISKETSYKVKFCMNKDAMVKTGANKSIKEFYNQRKRWASKGLFYADRLLVFKLVLIFLFYLSIPLQLFLIPLSYYFALSLSISLLIKYVTEYFILKEGTRILFDKSILKPFFKAELFHIPYIIISAVSGVFGNYSWKDRQIKR